jgi:3-hydroxyacyl-[acyl-carrier-protein] dehydratase
MPLNDFFTYEIKQQDQDTIVAKVTIDANHSLYKGHFPDQPVTPGVVLIEILRQIISGCLNSNMMLTGAKEIKYLTPVLPTETTIIEYQINYSKSEGAYSVNCVISQGEKIFTKIKGEFREQ